MGVAPDSAVSPYAAPVPLTSDHLIDGFDCGKPPLDAWLKTRALDNEGRASRTYVVLATVEPQRGEVVAYYTLATGGVALGEIRGKHRHNLPNPVPVMVLGRLAVDRRHGGHALGPALLREAMARALDISRVAGVRMLMVHAIDDEAATFYLSYGFHAFPAGGRTMFLLIETIAAALTSG